MKRDALASFFRRVVIAALPLAPVACSTQPYGNPDSSVGDSGVPLCGTAQAEPCLVPGEVPDGSVRCAVCPQQYDLCVEITVDGNPYVECFVDHTGRRPRGLSPAARVRGSAVGQWLARVAHLEAASVPAFRRLARDLARHGAPRRLVEACARAARDEIRHARAARAEARARGIVPPKVAIAKAPPASLEEIALENAVEGCVRESFGALQACWQAEAAGDRALRALSAQVAPDEAEHAELAWRIARWVEPRLADDQRERVAAARARAIDELRAQSFDTAPPELVAAAGVPTGAVARALVEAFTARAAVMARPAV